jgi:hypothetical protein
MEKKTTGDIARSRVGWADLEQWVRQQVQHLVQDILEQEMTEFLGRAKSTRRGPVGEGLGYRNGYGKPRALTLGLARSTSAGPGSATPRSGSRAGCSPSLSGTVPSSSDPPR